MSRSLQVVLLLCLPAVVTAADETRVTRLEQDVRNLQRELQALSRQIEQLRLQASRPGADARPAPPPTTINPAGPAWLDAAKWKRVSPGMPELEVLATLGPPTSTRDRGGARELLYALEVGTAAFLSGSVVLRDRKVVEVHVPTLK